MQKLRNIPFSPPDITEEEIAEVVDALRSGWITTGPKTKEFERQIAEYVGVNKAVCLNSATAAMELSLHILGIGPGDEVITSAYTYTASASVIHHVGAKIILVDTAPGSFEMDYDQLEKAITDKTKAIIPVDIAGVICDYERIYKAVENKKSLFRANNAKQESIGRVTVISDAAHSFGATRNNKKSGLLADITCFSFHAVKNLTTAEGGAVVWQHTFGMTDEEFYKEYMLYSLHGQSKDALSKMQKGGWEYDIVYPAFKNNMTDILAAVGLVQLKRYDALLERRFELIKLYEKVLDGKQIQVIRHYDSNFRSSGHLLLCNFVGLTVEQRNKVIIELADKGISTNVHYKPLPMFTAYKNLGFHIEDYPNAYIKYSNEVTLPLHTLLSNEDVKYVSQCVNTILNREEE
jgi:dTDP-4-amino-4,6-dideoxygalactose transaminase